MWLSWRIWYVTLVRFPCHRRRRDYDPVVLVIEAAEGFRSDAARTLPASTAAMIESPAEAFCRPWRSTIE